ncbi:MAG: hypothetical protein J7K73_02595 [Nanoarchaeota archaeon]|nr:hypothetical protein [Nanoarchaeota archaeon]
MKLKPFGGWDVVRILITFIVVVLVVIFVTPYSPYIVLGALGLLIYTLILEFIKFYLGLKELRKEKFEIATIRF